MKLSLLLPLMKKSDQRLVMGQRKVSAMNYNNVVSILKAWYVDLDFL